MAFYDAVDSVKKQRLGTRKRDIAGNEYIYLQGVADTVAGSWVNFDGGTSFTTALLDTDEAATQIGRIAVAKAAIVANKYGWYCIYGATTAVSEASATDGKNAFALATAGSVDDAPLAEPSVGIIFGAFYTSASSGGSASFVLNYPFMTGVSMD